MWGPPTWHWSTLMLSLGVGSLNLLAGWCILDKSLLGCRLTITNLSAQIISFNLPFAQYGYKGILYVFAASSELFTQPLDLNLGYTIGLSTFFASAHMVSNFPTIAINLFVLVLVVLLRREYRTLQKIAV